MSRRRWLGISRWPPWHHPSKYALASILKCITYRSAQLHRDFLDPLFPVIVNEYLVVAPHEIKYEELEVSVGRTSSSHYLIIPAVRSTRTSPRLHVSPRNVYSWSIHRGNMPCFTCPPFFSRQPWQLASRRKRDVGGALQQPYRCDMMPRVRQLTS